MKRNKCCVHASFYMKCEPTYDKFAFDDQVMTCYMYLFLHQSLLSHLHLMSPSYSYLELDPFLNMLKYVFLSPD